MKYKCLAIGRLLLCRLVLSFLRNQIKIFVVPWMKKKNERLYSIIREHATLDFPAWILLGNFEKLLLRPLFVGITMLNGLSTRCAMYSVNENIVLPTAHTVTRARGWLVTHDLHRIVVQRCSSGVCVLRELRVVHLQDWLEGLVLSLITTLHTIFYAKHHKIL